MLVLITVLEAWISLIPCDVKPLHSLGKKLSFPYAVKKIFMDPCGGNLSVSVHHPVARWLVAFISTYIAENR